MKKIVHILRWFNVLLIISTLLAYLSPFVSPVTFWPISVFGLGFPYLFLLNVLFAVIWAMMWQRYFWLSIGCLILGWGHFMAMFGWNGNHTKAVDDLVILNYNARGFYHVFYEAGKRLTTPKTPELETFLKAADADVLLLQEIGNTQIDLIQQFTPIPHIYQPPNKRVAILSKYPIRQRGLIDFKHPSHLAIWADVEYEGQPIRFYSLHLKSSSLNRDAIDAVTAGKVKEKATWSGLWGMIKDYKNYGKQRVAQMEKILQHIQSSPHPVVVGGDFNEPPTTYVYRQFTQQLHDGFYTAGQGIGSTYNGKIPLLKIDYLMVSPQLKVQHQEVKRVGFSDHFPVKSVVKGVRKK